MGLFDKFKGMFQKKKETTEEILSENTIEEVSNSDDFSNEEKSTIAYDKGLEKTRKEFVSELSLLGKKFTRVTEDYYEELESLLIKADIGVNTVFKFIDRFCT